MKKEIIKQVKYFGGTLVLILLGFIILGTNVSSYNHTERKIQIKDGVQQNGADQVTVTIAPRGGSTDTWIKRVEKEAENGQKQEIQYAGIIYDVMLTNQSSKAKITDWKLRINIPGDCYINNAWCGELEFHQDVEKAEKVQKLDLRKCIEKKVKIDLTHKIEGTDLMIPMTEGDYFVYIPSKNDLEDVIAQAHPDINEYFSKRVDFIAYHETQQEDLTPMEFSSAMLCYHLKREICSIPFFWILVALSTVWLIGLDISITVALKMRKILRQRQRDVKIIEQSMNAFMGFIDAKDPSTNGHSLRVAQYVKKIAEKLGSSEEECERVYYIGLMHDCGKIGIPEAILKKPDKLSVEEYEIMKTHTVLGEKILKDFSSIEGIREGVRSHHERYDGKGYPDGLAGEQIPKIARIICVADSFDAMNSVRCYQNHLQKEAIIQQLMDNRGTQFDPEIVDCFMEMLQDGTILF